MKKTPSLGNNIATKLSYTVNQTINWCNHSEKLFYKIIAEHTTPLCPSDYILMYTPKEMCTYIAKSHKQEYSGKKMDQISKYKS